MPSLQPPLAFGFAYLAMLGWLAAAAAPILIHLWMRHTHRETPWAAMRFLRAAIERHSRRLRFEQWLLLAIRTLLLVLVALAAAKPFFDRWRLSGAGVRTHHLLVLDASFSMGYRSADATLATRAKQLASELIDNSPAGDSYSLCLMAQAPTAPLRQPLSDRALARKAVQSAELTATPVDLPASLKLIEQMLTDAKARTEQIDRHEVVFFTDLTRHTWLPACEAEADTLEDAPADSEAAAPTGSDGSAATALSRLSAAAAVSVIDVGDESPANLALTSCQIVDELPTTQQPVTIAGKIEGFGVNLPASTNVELVVDGVATDERSVSLTGGAAVVEFTHRFARPGAHAVQLRLASDALTLDNSRYAAPLIKPQVDILLVEGRRGAAKYVAAALAASAGQESPFRTKTVSDAELSGIALSSFACVYFCNVPQLSRAEAALVERYVAGGGGVVFFLGDAVEPERYNDAFAAPFEAAQASRTPFQVVSQAERTSLLPVRIEAAVSRSAGVLDPLEYRHPLVHAFRGQQRSGLLTTPITKYFVLRPTSAAARSDVALAADNGDPLLIGSHYNRGRCVLVATAPSLDSLDSAGQPWTALPAWPSFLPLVREMTSFVVAGQREAGEALVGETLVGEVTELATSAEVVRPDGRRDTLVTPAAGATQWSYPQTSVPGVYKVTGAPGGNNEESARAFAVNVDPAESDLTRLGAAKLPAEVQVRRAPAAAGSAPADFGGQSALHRWLLTAALVLAVVETFLAQRFGRGGAS